MLKLLPELNEQTLKTTGSVGFISLLTILWRAFTSVHPQMMGSTH